jgi:hypothetical protein
MTEQHKATPEQWQWIQDRATPPISACILELRARVEALEARIGGLQSSHDTTASPAKPPLGLRPRWLANETRLAEVQAAIDRYKAADWIVPVEWFHEAHELREAMQPRIIASAEAQPTVKDSLTPLAGSLVERVRNIIGLDPVGDGKARAVLRDIAAWLRTEDDGLLGMGCDFARLLEQEATR